MHLNSLKVLVSSIRRVYFYWEIVLLLAPYLGINPVQGRAVFQAADLNHDGVLSREELNNIADFKRADLNHDGRVDPYEMQVYSGRSGLGYRKSPYTTKCL